MINNTSLSLTPITPKATKGGGFTAAKEPDNAFGEVFYKASTVASEHKPNVDKALTDSNQNTIDQEDTVDQSQLPESGLAGRKDELLDIDDSVEDSDYSGSDAANESDIKLISTSSEKESVDGEMTLESQKISVDGNSMQENRQKIAALPTELRTSVHKEALEDVTHSTDIESESPSPKVTSSAADTSEKLNFEPEQSGTDAKLLAPDGSSIVVDESDKGLQVNDSTTSIAKQDAVELDEFLSDLESMPKDSAGKSNTTTNYVTSAFVEGVNPQAIAPQPKDRVKTDGLLDMAVGTQISNTSDALEVNADVADEEINKSETINLKWVMEQLSSRSESSERATSVAGTKFDKVDVLAANEDFSDLLENSELNLDIEVLKESEAQGVPRKSLDQVVTGLNGQPQYLQTNTSVQFSANAAARTDLQAQLTMQSMPHATAWASEMTQKVSWVAKEGMQTAHIRLDPPELGSLTVKVTIDQDSNTHVSFVASSASARDALEGQMQRLREMLQQQGIELDSVDVEVSQRNDQSQNSETPHDRGAKDEVGDLGPSGDLESDEDLENIGFVAPASKGIDFYA